jgi:hypothetical protein
MPLVWQTTDRIATEHGCKVLVYAGSGWGKTKLASTAPTPVICSAEAGLLSLRRYQILATEIHNLEEVYEFYRWCVGSNEARYYQTVVLDSITEIAERCLAFLIEKKFKDVRQAYGQLIQDMEPLIRAFRDLKGKHIYMSAKMDPLIDEVNKTVQWGPSMPGRKLGPALPYFFDEVFCLRLHPQKDEQGNNLRYIQTQPELQYGAKDRSGALAPMEPPDLSHLFNKMLNGYVK